MSTGSVPVGLVNENVIKNVASEICRECKSQNVVAELEFVYYLIELLLLNPKYGKIFSKNINRGRLECFVKEIVDMLAANGVPVVTVKMQYIVESNYDDPQTMVEAYANYLKLCLKPLLFEIVETFPETSSDEQYHALLRKISMYIILTSGLGNPAFIATVKEGLAALESVFSLADAQEFAARARGDKVLQLKQLVGIVSGCRLFNRDCLRGGEGIPDLPFNLVDANSACLHSVSNILHRILERVHALTAVISGQVCIDPETNEVKLKVMESAELALKDYTDACDLLVFYRQYEVIVRKLLRDVEVMFAKSNELVEKVRITLKELHEVVKFRVAVPVAQVFPYFHAIWNLWRSMQSEMYLVSKVNQLMNSLDSLQDSIVVPKDKIELMLTGKTILTDQERLERWDNVSSHKRLLSLMPHYVRSEEAYLLEGVKIQYMGFCAISLCVGALIPGNPKAGYVKWKARYYSFSSTEFALRFARDPPRYILEVTDLARNKQCIINLLGLVHEVYLTRNVDCLIVRPPSKKMIEDKMIQTETHPIEENIVKGYSWNLWEHKRVACQWSNIVKCKTHSTQTNYSHMRSEIQCQTTEPRDKCYQTRRDNSTNVPTPNVYLWGLRGRLDDKQCSLDLTLPTWQ